MDVQRVSITGVRVQPRRRREYSEEKARELSSDISINGLLNPITVMRMPDGTLELLAGLHRMRAHDILGLTEIDANVLEFAGSTVEELKIRALIIEVSENLMDHGLSLIERGEHAILYEECLERLGYRKKAGRPRKENLPDSGGIPIMGNREIAHLFGKGGTQYRSLKQALKGIAPPIKQKLVGTHSGNTLTELLMLSKMNILEQIAVSTLIISGEAQNVRDARRSLERAGTRAMTQETEAPKGTYRTIVLDPPWDPSVGGDVDPFGKIAPAYPTMTYEELEALPVPEYADEDGCHLYLWYTARTAEAAFRLARSYGFRPVTSLVWDKIRPGTGHWFRMRHEMILFCVTGNMPLACRDYDSVIREQRRRHSEKPQKFYQIVRECSPGPRLEMFARTQRDGFISFGTLEHEREDAALTAL